MMERYLSIIQVVNKGMDLVAGTALVSDNAAYDL